MTTQDFIEKDYYKTLGVPKDADKTAIRKAYRKLAREYHPDVKPGDKAAEDKFKEISEAYDVLSDDERRKSYDEARTLFGSGGFRAGPGGGMPGFDLGDLFGAAGGGGFGDILGGMFAGGPGRGRGRARRNRGADLETEATIDFLDAARGTTVPMQVTSTDVCATCGGSGATPGTQVRQCDICNGAGHVARAQGGFAISEPCRACRGRGSVPDTPCQRCDGNGTVVQTKTLTIRVPPGVADGQRIRLAGRGEPGSGGAPAGDLFVRVHVRPHPIFTRTGDDLTLVLPVTFPEAALGATVPVPTLDGATVSVKIPPGTSSGRVLRLRGKGLEHGKRRGDLLVTVDVVVPNKLDGKAKAALEQYRDAAGDADPRAHLYTVGGDR